jgi:hypothetical protein
VEDGAVSKKLDRVVWTLKDARGGYVFASGNWMAPLIFRNRELARVEAKLFRDHGIKVKPLRIRLRVSVEEVEA